MLAIEPLDRYRLTFLGRLVKAGRRVVHRRKLALLNFKCWF